VKNHYNYRITNIRINKHYYGVRTCECNPKEDIGFKYFSSSKDKEFILDQKENPGDYKYKVVKKHENREQAILMEIKLHNRFDVAINENFYNRSKQTSTGFDTTGIPPWNKGLKNLGIGCFKIGNIPWNKGKTGIFSEEVILNMSNIAKGKVMAKELDTGKIVKVTKEEFKSNNNLVGSTSGDQVGSNNGMAKQINIYNNKDKLLFECNGNFSKICKENNIPIAIMRNTYYNNTKINIDNAGKRGVNWNAIEKKRPFIGWYARYVIS